jgi:hypothetical protein
MRQLKAELKIVDGGSREGREDREGFETGLSDRIAEFSERGVRSADFVHIVKNELGWRKKWSVLMKLLLSSMPPGKRFGLGLMAFHLGVAVAVGAQTSSAADDPLAWPAITSQTKPWAFNWWMGSAVDKTNLTRELERYAAAGLGGIHIIPIYGAVGYENNYINYLSPQWMDMMGWTVSEAHRLGMGVDMTTGTGWCFGGPQVTDKDANASVVVKTYALGVGEKIPAKFDRQILQALVAFGPDGKSIDLMDSISASGYVSFSPPGNWISSGTNTAPPRTWKVYAISQKPSGQKVKRAAPGGEGWMINLIYPSAMDDFLRPFTTAFANYEGPKPRGMFQDSYEYKSDWSPTFLAEFAKRRGYKLQTELPVLFSTNVDDHAARVKCDYRQTVSEIMAEESIPEWVKWSHQEGFITRYQAHGSPANWLDLYADADIPETEMFHADRNILVSKFASSAAHVAGHPLTSAETGTWLKEHFTVTLGDLKGLADQMFLAGVNHIFYHGLCYSPDEAAWPGWQFYASTEVNPRNSIWRDIPTLNKYIERCQSILQSGRPDNDILLYWPIEDYWMQPGKTLLPQLTVQAREWFEDQPIGNTASTLWQHGYAFDYVSDAQLRMARVVNGKIQMPGAKYQVIVVPACQYMPLETFKQLLALAKKGARIVFEGQLPADVSGERDFQHQRKIFQKLSASISADAEALPIGGFEKKMNRGEILAGDLERILPRVGVEPELMAASGVSFVRRTFPEGWEYFIANLGEIEIDKWLPVARAGDSAVILDPMTGKTGVAAFREYFDHGEVHLQLPPGGSLILRVFAGRTVEGQSWDYWKPVGNPEPITGEWQVDFMEGGPTLPAPFQTNRLGSWTGLGDTNAQTFAGTAKYEITFAAPNSTGKTYFLDLGDVRESARVALNGKDYGTVISTPFRVVVDHLKSAGNVLQVEVTSLAANRIRDLDRRGVKWKTFHDINFVDINYKPFDASNWPLTDCGLLGPVTLTPVSRE